MRWCASVDFWVFFRSFLFFETFFPLLTSFCPLWVCWVTVPTVPLCWRWGQASLADPCVQGQGLQGWPRRWKSIYLWHSCSLWHKSWVFEKFWTLMCLPLLLWSRGYLKKMGPSFRRSKVSWCIGPRESRPFTDWVTCRPPIFFFFFGELKMNFFSFPCSRGPSGWASWLRSCSRSCSRSRLAFKVKVGVLLMSCVWVSMFVGIPVFVYMHLWSGPLVKRNCVVPMI